MNIDLSSTFTAMFGFIIQCFRSVLQWLDGIKIYNSNVSLLDLNIAFAVFGVLFTALFAVVRNGVSNSHSEKIENERAAVRSANVARRRDAYNRSISRKNR